MVSPVSLTSRSSVRSLLVTVALALALMRSSPVEAQDAKERARTSLVAGVDLLGKGDAAGALLRFQEAYQLVPSPKIFYNLGLAYAALGRPVEALEAFQKFLSESSDAPLDARQNAEAEARRLRGELGSLRVTTDVPGGAVFVDERPYGQTPEHQPIMLLPGSHMLVVRPPGGAAPMSVRVDVARGEVRTIAVQTKVVAPEPSPHSMPAPVVPVPVVPAPVAPTRHTAGNPATPSAVPGTTGVRLTGIGMAVLGVVGLGTGAAFSMKMKATQDALEKKVAGQEMVNGAQVQAEYSSGKRYQTAQFVAYGLGAAALVAGVSLYLMGGTTERAPDRAEFAVTPVIAPGAAGAVLRSTF